MAILGDAVVKVDGTILKTVEGSARLTPGGIKGMTRKGGGQIHGRSKMTQESKVTADVLPDQDFDIEKIQGIDGATIEFADANGGPAWVISNAWFTEMGEIEEGENSKVNVTFEGTPAQKVG